MDFPLVDLGEEVRRKLQSERDKVVQRIEDLVVEILNGVRW